MAAQGVWSADLAKESSTMREILAVRKVLQSFAPKVAGLCVKWHTDNQNVARIIDVGSRKSGWQSETERIFEICVHHGISIVPEWVPRSSNEQADYLIRIVDFDDWSVSPHIFRFSDLKWQFLLLVFALTIKVGALSVYLLSMVSVLFFGGYLYNFLVILFSVS